MSAVAHIDVLPSATPDIVRLVAEVDDPYARLRPDYDAVRAGDLVPPPAFLPHLVWEYGLGELTPYVPSVYQLIEAGIRWQRVRGTPRSIELALAWIGYAASLEEEPPRRRWWSRVQLGLDRLADAEAPDLGRIEGLTQLSLPIRSRFRRGYHGYDVRALETGYGRTSAALTGDHSGVRIGGAAQWSFGRTHEVEHEPSGAELSAAGVWVPDVDESPAWAGLAVAWAGADWPWSAPAAVIRRRVIAAALAARPVRIGFRDADGEIGSRRAVCRPVAEAIDGEYAAGSTRWTAATEDPTAVLVHATTDFGDGVGRTATTIGLLFGATPADPARPGLLWAGPGETAGGDLVVEPVGPGAWPWFDAPDPEPPRMVAAAAVDIPFRRTVRERCLFLLRI